MAPIRFGTDSFYCGTGWRGAEAFMCAWLMGWPRIAVYDGGWFDWCIDEERPLETGIPDNVPEQFMKEPAAGAS